MPRPPHILHENPLLAQTETKEPRKKLGFYVYALYSRDSITKKQPSHLSGTWKNVKTIAQTPIFHNYDIFFWEVYLKRRTVMVTEAVTI